jgi:hypothetical protein
MWDRERDNKETLGSRTIDWQRATELVQHFADSGEFT